MKYLFFLLFAPLFVFSATIDRSLIDNNESAQIYENYLARLNTLSPNDSNLTVQLEKSLLYKLINITKFSGEKKPIELLPQNINDASSYILSFKILLSQKTRFEDIEKTIIQTNEKISYLHTQITRINSDDTLPSVLQLQYAFYVKTKQKLQKRKKHLQEAVKHNKAVLIEKMKNIDFDKEKAQEDLIKLKKEFNDVTMQLEDVKIEKERLLLLDKKERLTATEQKLDTIAAGRDKAAINIIDNALIRYFAALKAKSRDLFDIEKEIKKWLAMLSQKEQQDYSLMVNILDALTLERLGKTKIFINRTREGIKYLEQDIWEKLNYPLFTINEKPISSWSFIVAMFILIIGFTAAKFYRRYVKRITHSVINVTPSTEIIISNIGNYLILLIVFFIMLKSIGLDLSSLTLIAGALSVGIGFGLQNIVANFISGIILLFEKSIKIGDFIQISDNLRGQVIDIQMRSVTIRTNDNIDIIVPNQTFIQHNVINWTLGDNLRRIRIPFGVAYGSEIKKVKTAVIEALEKSSLHFIRDDETKQPIVVMMGMNTSSVDFELFVWVGGEETLKPLRTADKFLVLIYNALYENGIEIPFPQVDVHVRDIKDNLEIIRKDKNNGGV